jgi:hypothetical protein
MIPVNLIPVLSDKFQGFDRASPTVKACTLLRPVLEYLWAVHKNLIQPIMLSKERCIESQDWASRLHFANIPQLAQTMLPPPFPLPPPSQAPAENQLALDASAGDHSNRILTNGSKI